MSGLVVAVDGGNSKTDLALLAGGEPVAWVRGPGGALGPERTTALIARLARHAARSAGLTPDALRGAGAVCCLAGVDLPAQAEAMRAALAADGTLGRAEVVNDARALLRMAAPPAVAVVCGAGLKCVARSGGEHLEFPSMGWQSGDLSGGGDFLAREAVRAAVRAEDGRGPYTSLRAVVVGRLGVPAAGAVAERLFSGALTEDALGALVPYVLAAARSGDLVAASIVDVLAGEVATLARAARRRLAGHGWNLVLGGGLFGDPRALLLGAVRAADPVLEREFTVVVPGAPPIAGAALLALDRLGTAVDDDRVQRAFGSAGGETPELLDSGAG